MNKETAEYFLRELTTRYQVGNITMDAFYTDLANLAKDMGDDPDLRDIVYQIDAMIDGSL